MQTPTRPWALNPGQRVRCPQMGPLPGTEVFRRRGHGSVQAGLLASCLLFPSSVAHCLPSVTSANTLQDRKCHLR